MTTLLGVALVPPTHHSTADQYSQGHTILAKSMLGFILEQITNSLGRIFSSL
jgi:hypothetical protein